jgi:tellurite methyltransferase
MEIEAWERRYGARERAAEDFASAPTPLLVSTAGSLPPGRALDLACGTGRNALWLAERGWRVTAVDGAASAIRVLQERSAERRLKIDAHIADLSKHRFEMASSAWDLIVICYYLQRTLFARAKRSVVPGGMLLAIVHIAGPGEPSTPHRLHPGELKEYFRRWEILHDYEGSPVDAAHKRAVAEIVARKPNR